MTRMEFLKRSWANTSTLISVNTGTASYMIDRLSTVFAGTLATTTATTLTADITINQETNRIIIENTNWKNFSITNSGTALSLSSSCEGTSTASWTGNSATNLYIQIPTTTIDTLNIIVNSNTAGNLTHTIEQLWVCQLLYQFEQNPAATDFMPELDRKEYIHELSDGGTTQYILNDYYKASMRIENISEDQKDQLYNVYNQKDAIVFSPYPTTTSWDREIYEVNWLGRFDFIRRSHNLKTAGFSGQFRLVETPK